MEGAGSWDALEWTKIEVGLLAFVVIFVRWCEFFRLMRRYLLGIELGFLGFGRRVFPLWQPISRSVSHVKCDFLLEAEEVVVEVGQFVFRDEQVVDCRGFLASFCIEVDSGWGTPGGNLWGACRCVLPRSIIIVKMVYLICTLLKFIEIGFG